MTTSFRTICLSLIVAALLAGCAGGDRREGSNASQGNAVADSGAAVGVMDGMQGMGSVGMLEQMQAHMGRIDGISIDSMRTVMAMHRQMVANMISQMNREMREMSMTGDAAWEATIDSVRQDLIHLPAMGDTELREVMPAHRTRVIRLVEAHRTMMQNMKR